MNDTKNQSNKQDQKNRRQSNQQKHGSRKQGNNTAKLHDNLKPHEQEHPETRMTR
jgi:hypothetical protein